MNEKIRPLAFFEICGGEFAGDAQAEFERVQKMVQRLGKQLSFTMKMTVFPNDQKKGYPRHFMEVSYQVIPASITKTSERFVAEINDGKIVGDAETVALALQQELWPEANLKNVSEFVLKTKEGTNDEQ